jgi:FMN phosphatase YigB (HAD superfamily)
MITEKIEPEETLMITADIVDASNAEQLGIETYYINKNYWTDIFADYNYKKSKFGSVKTFDTTKELANELFNKGEIINVN